MEKVRELYHYEEMAPLIFATALWLYLEKRFFRAPSPVNMYTGMEIRRKGRNSREFLSRHFHLVIHVSRWIIVKLAFLSTLSRVFFWRRGEEECAPYIKIPYFFVGSLALSKCYDPPVLWFILKRCFSRCECISEEKLVTNPLSFWLSLHDHPSSRLPNCPRSFKTLNISKSIFSPNAAPHSFYLLPQ